MDNQHIKSDPEIIGRALCFRDARVPVQTPFDYITGNSSLGASRHRHRGPGATGPVMTSTNRRCLHILAIFAMPLPAYADSVLDEFVGLNFLMLFAVLAVFLASLVLSRRPWMHKVWMALSIACSLMLLLILGGLHAIDMPNYTAPLFWVLPAAAWAGMSRWLSRK